MSHAGGCLLEVLCPPELLHVLQKEAVGWLLAVRRQVVSPGTRVVALERGENVAVRGRECAGIESFIY